MEGFKSGPAAKLEVHRPALGKPPLWPDRTDILAIATDAPLSGTGRAVLPLAEPAGVAEWTLAALAEGALRQTAA